MHSLSSQRFNYSTSAGKMLYILWYKIRRRVIRRKNKFKPARLMALFMCVSHGFSSARRDVYILNDTFPNPFVSAQNLLYIKDKAISLSLSLPKNSTQLFFHPIYIGTPIGYPHCLLSYARFWLEFRGKKKIGNWFRRADSVFTQTY